MSTHLTAALRYASLTASVGSHANSGARNTWATAVC